MSQELTLCGAALQSMVFVNVKATSMKSMRIVNVC